MKNVFSLPRATFLFSLLLFSSVLLAQLTDQQKAALNIYIESTPELSKYGKGIREKILDDSRIIINIKLCSGTLKKYSGLEKSRNMEDLAEMYSELGQSASELRDKFLPDFKKLDYKNTMAELRGNTLKIDAAKHAALINHYSAGRKDRLDPANTFGSMIIQYPEYIESLRKAINTAYNGNVDDARMNLWLEMSYYQKMRVDAVKQIVAEKKNVGEELKTCLSSLHGKFEELAERENNSPQNWTGVFGNDQISLKFEESRGYLFATSDKRLGGAVESSQWNLSLNVNKAEGDWLVTYVDDEKTIKRSGTITLKLDGDIMTFDMLGTDWSIEWKPDAKPYETETAATTKGIRMTGTLTRKNK